jgi:hypothetical protein
MGDGDKTERRGNKIGTNKSIKNIIRFNEADIGKIRC